MLKPENVKQQITISLPNFLIWAIDKEAKSANISKERAIEELLEFIYNGSILNATNEKDPIRESTNDAIRGSEEF